MSTRWPAVTRSRPIRLVTEEVIASVRVERSAEDCFEVYSQLDRVPEWSVGIGQIDIVSETRSEWTAACRVPSSRCCRKFRGHLSSRPNRMSVIEWKSVSGISNNGKVNFRRCHRTRAILRWLSRTQCPIGCGPLSPPDQRGRTCDPRQLGRREVQSHHRGGRSTAGAADGSDNTEARLEAMRVEQRVSTVTAALTAALGSSDIGLLGATIGEAEAASVDRARCSWPQPRRRLEELLAAGQPSSSLWPSRRSKR